MDRSREPENGVLVDLLRHPLPRQSHGRSFGNGAATARAQAQGIEDWRFGVALNALRAASARQDDSDARDRDHHGNLRFYFRRPGKPKIRLRGLPGSEEFLAAYKAALAESQGVKSEKSFEWLCNRCYKSTYVGSLDDSTQRRRRTVLDEICNMVGESGRRLGLAPFASLKKVHVRKLRDMKADTPEAASFRLKQIFLRGAEVCGG